MQYVVNDCNVECFFDADYSVSVPLINCWLWLRMQLHC